MNKERYQQLMRDHTLRLTPEEVQEGWHFCYDWDGLLIHTSHPEFDVCSCPNGDKAAKLVGSE